MSRCGELRPSRRARWRALVLVSVHVAIGAHVLHWLIAGSTITPVEPSEAMQSLETGLVNAGFVLFAAAILATAVFGRFFCGWACHLLALQDLCAWLLKKVGIRPKPIRSRLLAWVPLGAALYMFVWPTARRLLAGQPAPPMQAHFVTDDFWATFPGPAVAVLTFVVCGFVIVWWLGSKGFCTYGCPYGGFFALADRVAPGRILVSDACDGCGHCTATCTSNVRVHEEVRAFRMVVDAGCMKCLDCVDVCPKDALRFGFASPRLAPRPRRTWSFTWREELAAAAVFVAALLAFRSLYGVVPFLLSIGLAVLTASAVLVGWRLLRRVELTWQRHLLKDRGRLTRVGRAAAAGLLLWLALFAHSAWVQVDTWRGTTLLGEAMRTPPGPHQDALCADSERLLLRADGLGLTYDGRIGFALAQLDGRRRDFAAAEGRLRRVLDHNPRDLLARLTLANVVAAQGRGREAESELVEVLRRDPRFTAARVRLQALRAELGR